MVQLMADNLVPLTDLQRRPGKVVAHALASAQPVVITQHGRPAVVMVGWKQFEALERAAIPLEEAGQAMGSRERDLREELQRIALAIVAKYDPEKIILFGSLTSGRVTGTSDIDLVIVKKTSKRFWERQKELAKLVRPRLACDLFVYTPSEWKRAIAEGRDFASREIEEKGRVIYDRAS